MIKSILDIGFGAQITAFPLFKSNYDTNAFSYWLPKIINSFALEQNGRQARYLAFFVLGRSAATLLNAIRSHHQVD